MSGTRWRCLVESPRLGHVLGDIELVDRKLDETLCRPGKLTASLPMSSPSATREVLEPAARAIYLLRDDQVHWGGLVWGVGAAPGSESIALNVEGWLGYWDHRHVWRSRAWGGEDPFIIFRTLVRDAQNDPVHIANASAPDLGIDVTWDTLSGLAIPFSVYDYQAKPLGEVLRSLCADCGFDMEMRYSLTGAGITKRIHLTYPRQGRTLSDPWRFEFDTRRGAGGNVLRAGLDESATDMAWRVRGWGQGEDAQRPRAQRIATNMGAYVPLDAAPTWTDEASKGRLGLRTKEYIGRSAKVTRLPSIEVHADAEPKWGTWGLGDVVTLDLQDRWRTLRGQWRVIGWQIDAETEIVSPRFEDPEEPPSAT